MKPFMIFFYIVFLTSCFSQTKEKDNQIKEEKIVNQIVRPIDNYFPVPYFPEKLKFLFGIPVYEIVSNWAEVSQYSVDLMTEKQKKFFLSLPEMQNDGKWSTSIELDFDNDGYTEVICYGAYRDKENVVGNFLLILRNSIQGNSVLLTKIFPDEGGRFACFYMQKKDHIIYFGSGLINSELQWKISWSDGQPKLVNLSDE